VQPRFRLTRVTPAPDEVVLVIEGRLYGEWVELLEDECAQLLRTTQRVLLDLASLSFVDRRGARLLRKLATDQVVLINCPPLVDELVREDAS
jgi:anti-anti-sigma regulatory factor